MVAGAFADLVDDVGELRQVGYQRGDGGVGLVELLAETVIVALKSVGTVCVNGAKQAHFAMIGFGLLPEGVFAVEAVGLMRMLAVVGQIGEAAGQKVFHACKLCR